MQDRYIEEGVVSADEGCRYTNWRGSGKLIFAVMHKLALEDPQNGSIEWIHKISNILISAAVCRPADLQLDSCDKRLSTAWGATLARKGLLNGTARIRLQGVV